MSRSAAVLSLAVAAFAAGFGALATLQHRAFSTGRFDVGNLVQAVWSTAHGNILETTGLSGREISRLGAHFDPIVVVFAPLWWLWPDASLLLVSQAVAVSLGALPVYWLARKHLESDWAGLGFALAYLLYPPTQWLVLDDFHPVALAAPLLLAAIWFLDEDRLLAFGVCAALACTTKEHVGLTVAALGLWYALTHRRVRAGLTIAACGMLVSLAAILVVVPHFAPGNGSPFAGRYAGVGGSPSGIAHTAISDPVRLLDAALSGHGLGYLVDLLLPLLGLPVLAPLLALAAMPELLLNLLSSTSTQTSIHFHYTAATTPVLAAGAVLGAARAQRVVPRLRQVLPRAVVVACLLAGIALGPLPAWRYVPMGETLAATDHLEDRHDAVARRALAVIPGAAPVSATNTLGAHLSARSRIFSFPVLAEATWVAVDERRPSALDAADAPVAFGRAYAKLRRDPAWSVVFAEDGIVVLRRT
jgi:uncharacterized membrane protein